MKYLHNQPLLLFSATQYINAPKFSLQANKSGYEVMSTATAHINMSTQVPAIPTSRDHKSDTSKDLVMCMWSKYAELTQQRNLICQKLYLKLKFSAVSH